jgi:hypothetical protein
MTNLGLKSIRKVRNGWAHLHGTEKLGEMDNSMELEKKGRELWGQFLHGKKPFAQKYGHFLLITCRVQLHGMADQEKEEEEEFFDNFCQFYVNYRIRLSLVLHVERRNGIRTCHLSALDGPKREEMDLVAKDLRVEGEDEMEKPDLRKPIRLR